MSAFTTLLRNTVVMAPQHQVMAPMQSYPTTMAHTGLSQNGGDLTGANRTGESCTDASRTGETRGRSTRTGEFLSGDCMTGEFITGEFIDGEIITGEFSSGEWLTGSFRARTMQEDANVTTRRWPLLLFGFVDTAAVLLTALRVPPRAVALGGDDATIGMLAAAFAVAQMASSIAWGRLSDRVGRPRVLVAGLLLIATSLILLALPSSSSLLLLSRVVHGVGSGTIGVAVAALLDGTHSRQRARILGELGGATSAGAIIAPLAFLLWGDASSELAHIVPLPEGILLAFVATTLYLVARPALLLRNGVAASVGHATPANLTSAHLTALPEAPVRSSAAEAKRTLLVLLGTYALAAGASSGLPPMLPHLLSRERGDPSPAACLMVLGAMGLILRTVLVAPIVARFGDRTTLRTGLATMSIGVVLLAMHVSTITTWGAMVTLAAGTALTFPTLGALLSRAASSSRRGSVIGLQHAVGGTARAALPLALGAAMNVGAAPVVLCVVGVALATVAAVLRRGATVSATREVTPALVVSRPSTRQPSVTGVRESTHPPRPRSPARIGTDAA